MKETGAEMAAAGRQTADRPTRNRLTAGFTVIEVLIAAVVVAILVAIAIPNYMGYREKAIRTQAVLDINGLQDAIVIFQREWKTLPADLASVDPDAPSDPWGNPYEYLDLTSGAPEINGKRRKDKSLVPINTDFDLYSKGSDGKSKAPLTAKDSHDDVVRANDGAFIGLATDY